MVTVFNFFPRGPATISNEPLEMGKVEMGNGIGCISGGKRKGEPERSLTFHLSDLLLTSLSLSLSPFLSITQVARSISLPSHFPFAVTSPSHGSTQFLLWLGADWRDRSDQPSHRVLWKRWWITGYRSMRHADYLQVGSRSDFPLILS